MENRFGRPIHSDDGQGYHGQDVSTATGYQILRWDVKRGYPNYDILVDNTGSTATSYVDRDITPNNTFIYQVRAWNDWGLGDRSFGATVKTMDLDVIGAPRNFRVSSSSEGAALTWDAPEGVADTDLRYRIYRRENSGATRSSRPAGFGSWRHLVYRWHRCAGL